MLAGGEIASAINETRRIYEAGPNQLLSRTLMPKLRGQSAAFWKNNPA